MRPTLLPTLFLSLLPTTALAEQTSLRICYETEDAMPFWTDAEQTNPGLLVKLT